ncbi:MAG: hypothetical protein AAGB18_01180 [Pseudomonadota bacterium]
MRLRFSSDTVAYLFLRDSTRPLAHLRAPLDHPRRAEFERWHEADYPRVSTLRAPGRSDPAILPKALSLWSGGNPTDPEHVARTIALAVDILSPRLDDFWVISRAARDVLEPCIGDHAGFIPVSIDVKGDPHLPCPGEWFFVDMLRQQSPVLEDRSAFWPLVYPGKEALDAALFCMARDVAGLTLWSGGMHRGPRFPDGLATSKMTYASDKVHAALTDAGLLDGWRTVPIRELHDWDGAEARNSPKALRRARRSRARVWRLGIEGALTSKKLAGDFAAVQSGEHRERYRFHVDADLPCLPLFEFHGCYFAAPKIRAILGPEHFSEAALYGDETLEHRREDAAGYGVLTARPEPMRWLPGLSRSEADGEGRLSHPSFGAVHFREMPAFEVGRLKSWSAWYGRSDAPTATAHLYVNDPTLNELIAASAIHSGVATLTPIKLYDPP